MIITIDGPVATGKSTIAKKVAEELHFIHFDTGAMYRCFTYALILAKIAPDDRPQIAEMLKTFTIDIRLVNGTKKYFLKGLDVTDAIRSQQVTQLVSQIAAYPEVRHALVAQQRQWAQGVNVVFEGRDLGTVVFPKADVKVFLTGRDDVRAKRRFDEIVQKYPDEAKKLSFEQVLHDLKERDRIDSTREHSPLKPARDAHLIDTSDLTIDEIVQAIIKLVP